MSNLNTVSRSLHDLGIATWFGGSLMGAVALNGAASDLSDPVLRTKTAQAGWGRWTPANLVAIAGHLAGGAMLTRGNLHRIKAQQGVLATTVIKGALTAGALGVTAYSRVLGEQVMRAGDVPSAGGTEPEARTPENVRKAQQKLRALQWTIPALTGSIIVLGAYMGEQQRTRAELKGALGRARQAGTSLAGGALIDKAAKGFAKKKKADAMAGTVKRAPGAMESAGRAAAKTAAKTKAARWATSAGPVAARDAVYVDERG